jgi:methylphosphotriester-DNA--protein-cysteine methyltransferase
MIFHGCGRIPRRRTARRAVVRLLLEDVTLTSKTKRSLHTFDSRAGSRKLRRCRDLSTTRKKDSTEVVTEIDRLLDHHTEKEIAGILNERTPTSHDDPEDE